MFKRVFDAFERPTVWAPTLTSALVGSVATLLIAWRLFDTADLTMLENLLAMIVCTWAGGAVLFVALQNMSKATVNGQAIYFVGALVVLAGLMLLQGLAFGAWLGAGIGSVAALLVGRSGFAAVQALPDRIA